MAGRGGVLLCEISSDLVGSVLRLHAASLLHVKNKLFSQPSTQTPLWQSPVQWHPVVQGGMEVGGVKDILFPD